MRNPPGTSPRRSLLHHAIHLLQAQPFRLRYTKVRKEQTQTTCTAPNKEDLGPQIPLIGIHHIRRHHPNNTIPEPVTRRRERHALGSDREREQLADDDPGSGTPGGGKGEDVEADECNEDLACGAGARGGGADDGDDEFGDQHKEGTIDEEGAAAEAFDSIEGERGGADVDDVSYDSYQKGVSDAGLLEEGCAVVDCGS